MTRHVDKIIVEIGGGRGNTTTNKLEITWVPEAQQPERLYAWNFLMGTTYADSTLPPVGDGFYYLVAAVNDCGSGGYGMSGLNPDPRAAITCP